MKISILSKSLMRTQKLDYLVLIIIFASIFVRLMTPAMINLNYDYDDFLGVRIANSVLNGNWLGAWDNRTLAKPPGYSLFLALSYWMHLDPILLIHLLYILISIYFLSSILKIFSLGQNRTYFRIGLFILLFNPTIFGADFSRIYRTSLNFLAAFAMATLVINLTCSLAATKSKVSNQKALLHSLGIGLMYGVLILTRSEGYWLLIPTVIIIFSALFLLKHKDENRSKSMSIVTCVIVFVGIFAGTFAPNEIVKTFNKRVYGVSLTENYYSGEFARALKLWSGVHPITSSNPFVFISKDQRLAVYAISPTAKKMEEYLEKPYDKNVWSWKSNNCNVTSICDESGSWLTWDIRDAATAVADISDELSFQTYFRKIADEISEACKSGKIECSKGGIQPGTKNLALISKKQILDQTVKALSTFPGFTQAINSARPLVGGNDPSYLNLWESTVRTDRVVTVSEYDLWKSFGHVQNFLGEIYSNLGFLFILVLIFATARSRMSKESKLNALLIAYSVISLLIFSCGIALFEIFSGFGQALSLYTIPAQPIFMILMILLSVDLGLFFSEKKSKDSKHLMEGGY